MKNSITTKGFTLIELIVVITIIGLLVAVVLASLSVSRQKGRDAQRASQTQEILKAFELFYSNNGVYPNDGVSGVGHAPVLLSSTGAQIQSSGLMPRIPEDPLYDSAEGYRYCSSDEGNSLALLVNIENDSGTDYCVVSRGPLEYSNTLCSGIASLDRCATKF